MRHVIDLVPMPYNPREPAGAVVWDDRAGTVTGDEPAASRLRSMLEAAKQHGSTGTHPIPSSIAITDPFHVRREFAAVLGWCYTLPAWLEADYPRQPRDVSRDQALEPGAHEVDVINAPIAVRGTRAG